MTELDRRSTAELILQVVQWLPDNGSLSWSGWIRTKDKALIVLSTHGLSLREW